MLLLLLLAASAVAEHTSVWDVCSAASKYCILWAGDRFDLFSDHIKTGWTVYVDHGCGCTSSVCSVIPPSLPVGCVVSAYSAGQLMIDWPNVHVRPLFAGIPARLQADSDSISTTRDDLRAQLPCAVIIVRSSGAHIHELDFDISACVTAVVRTLLLAGYAPAPFVWLLATPIVVEFDAPRDMTLRLLRLLAGGDAVVRIVPPLGGSAMIDVDGLTLNQNVGLYNASSPVHGITVGIAGIVSGLVVTDDAASLFVLDSVNLPGGLAPWLGSTVCSECPLCLCPICACKDGSRHNHLITIGLAVATGVGFSILIALAIHRICREHAAIRGDDEDEAERYDARRVMRILTSRCDLFSHLENGNDVAATHVLRMFGSCLRYMACVLSKRGCIGVSHSRSALSYTPSKITATGTYWTINQKPISGYSEPGSDSSSSSWIVFISCTTTSEQYALDAVASSVCSRSRAARASGDLSRRSSCVMSASRLAVTDLVSPCSRSIVCSLMSAASAGLSTST